MYMRPRSLQFLFAATDAATLPIAPRCKTTRQHLDGTTLPICQHASSGCGPPTAATFFACCSPCHSLHYHSASLLPSPHHLPFCCFTYQHPTTSVADRYCRIVLLFLFTDMLPVRPVRYGFAGTFAELFHWWMDLWRDDYDLQRDIRGTDAAVACVPILNHLHQGAFFTGRLRDSAILHLPSIFMLTLPAFRGP